MGIQQNLPSLALPRILSAPGQCYVDRESSSFLLPDPPTVCQAASWPRTAAAFWLAAWFLRPLTGRLGVVRRGDAVGIRCWWCSAIALLERLILNIAISLNERLPRPTNHRNTQRSQSSRVVRLDDQRRWQHRVIWADMRRIFRGLLYRLHLLFASRVVERAHYDRLP